MKSEWLDLFRRALADHYGDRPVIAALATADADGRPRVRHVVCRRVDDDGGLWIAVDARSAKVDQLAAHPHAELAFWLAGDRDQFRARGAAAVLTGPEPDRAALWRSLSDTARALFAWPPPGTPREPDPARFPAALPPGDAPPPSFAALVIRPDEFEHLALRDHPHLRRIWRAVDGWIGRDVNP